MSQAATKLFRKSDDAAKALDQLHAKGLGADKISVLASDRAGKAFISKHLSKSKSVDLQLTTAHVAGAAANALSGDKDVQAALSEALGISPDTYDYYRMGVSLGGVLISVQSEGAVLADVKKILRAASTEVKPARAQATSPGFATDARMAATDPVDAAMSGDFRKY